MKLLFSDSSTVDITLADLPINTAFLKMCKNLQHVPIPFDEWDSPYYYDNHSYKDLVNRLAGFGAELSIEVDCTRCSARDYLNELHAIYEKNYNGNPTWLKFHEHIHLTEHYHRPRRNILRIDYREKGGPATKPMEYEWLTNMSTKIKRGEVFFFWAELGKTPHQYWTNNEPENFDRLCELAKPWINFRPILNIAVNDIDLADNPNIKDFKLWWPTYHNRWCQHWGIPKWTAEQMLGGIVVGTVNNLSAVETNLQKNIFPTFLKL